MLRNRSAEPAIALPRPRQGVSIRSALAALLAVMIVIVAGQAWFSLRQLGRMHEELTRITTHWLPAIDSADRINIGINDVRGKQYRFFVTDEPELQKARHNLDRGTQAVADARRTYETLIDSREEQQAYDRFSREWARYGDLWERVAGLFGMGRRDEALALFKTDMWAVSDDAGAALDGLVDIVRRETAQAAEAAETANRHAGTAIEVALGLALAIAGMAAAYVLVRIARPLGSMTDALTRLAAGDRGFTIPEIDRRDEIGQMAKAFEVFRANTLDLENAHRVIQIAREEAQSLARHDALTGLPNRRLFAGEIEEAIRRAEAGTAQCSVLLIDLDGFKPVNDRFGHATGDAVLCAIANRLKGLVRGADLAARLGGDEFALVTAQAGHTAAGRDALIRLAGQVTQAVQEPISIGASCVRISASVGVASYPADGDGIETLIRAADLAMYRAKQVGPGGFMFFERSFDEEIRARATLEAELRQAIAAGDIRPFYQPIVELAGHRIVGFEVLARWNHPERGFVPADLFITMAEQLDVIADLTTSVLRQACLDVRHWPDDIVLALNVSAVELHDMSLPTRIMAVLSAADFPPSRLEVEITETALIHDQKTARAVMIALQTLGIKLALDDFGTGYSSLNHLVHLSFDKLKIDRSFVQAMHRDPECAKIVDAVLTLARSFGVAAIAEGIESEAALERLVAGGCMYGQGYFLGKPAPAADAFRLLGAGAPEALALSASA